MSEDEIEKSLSAIVLWMTAQVKAAEQEYVDTMGPVEQEYQARRQAAMQVFEGKRTASLFQAIHMIVEKSKEENGESKT